MGLNIPYRPFLLCHATSLRSCYATIHYCCSTPLTGTTHVLERRSKPPPHFSLNAVIWRWSASMTDLIKGPWASKPSPAWRFVDVSSRGKGLADIGQGLNSWRIWLMFAWNDVRRRYRRSGLGQFWLTLSMAMTVGGLGFVNSQLFGVDITKYLPYKAVTFVAWGTISSVVKQLVADIVEVADIKRQRKKNASDRRCDLLAGFA